MYDRLFNFDQHFITSPSRTHSPISDVPDQSHMRRRPDYGAKLLENWRLSGVGDGQPRTEGFSFDAPTSLKENPGSAWSRGTL